jgi:hypothetical protein
MEMVAAVQNTSHILAGVGLAIVAGAVGFVLAWYTLGLGIGIAHRGYRRTRPQLEPLINRTYAGVRDNVVVPTYNPRGNRVSS